MISPTIVRFRDEMCTVRINCCECIVLVLLYLQLIALLREVKYFSQRVVSHQPIPERALSVFSQNDTYNMFTQNLDVIVSLYNW